LKRLACKQKNLWGRGAVGGQFKTDTLQEEKNDLDPPGLSGVIHQMDMMTRTRLWVLLTCCPVLPLHADDFVLTLYEKLSANAALTTIGRVKATVGQKTEAIARIDANRDGIITDAELSRAFAAKITRNEAKRDIVRETELNGKQGTLLYLSLNPKYEGLSENKHRFRVTTFWKLQFSRLKIGQNLLERKYLPVGNGYRLQMPRGWRISKVRGLSKMSVSTNKSYVTGVVSIPTVTIEFSR